jgi:hypothetical protein
MRDQARWPTWTAGRVVGTVVMILVGLAVGFVGAFVASLSNFGFEGIHTGRDFDIPEAIPKVLLGVMLAGLPASIPFFIMSRLRRRPFWSWLGAFLLLIGGGLGVAEMSSYDALSVVESLAVLASRIFVTGAIGWTRHRTLRRQEPPPT